MVEQILQDYDLAYNLQSICLRYFNAAGADPSGRLGERHNPETHLIPLVLQAASGRRKNISIYGDDYPTQDGTCIRDYIYVMDLCEAHLCALRALEDKSNTHSVINLGSQDGYTVKEVIEMCRTVTGRDIPVKVGGRRPGDPAQVVASNERAHREIGWRPGASLKKIIETSWEWELAESKRRSKK